MQRILSLIFILLLPSLAAAQSITDVKGLASSEAIKSTAGSLGGSLPAMLQSQFDLSEDQASGGIGSMLDLASNKLSAGEYDQLAGMIPGAEQYIASARRLGAISGPVKNLSDLTTALSSLGISQDTIAQFVPAVTRYLGKLGGGDIQGLLTKAFGA